MNFHNQTVLVVGGSGGIGRSTVRMLAERGATVVAGFHTNGEAAAATAADCTGLPGSVTFHQVDLRDKATVERFVHTALEQSGQIDAVVNCAGITAFAAIEQLTLAAWQATLATNLDGVYNMCKAVLRPMMKRRSGRIVNFAALHGAAGGPFQADYSAASGGVLGFTRGLAREAAPWNITVNAVAPGMIATDQLAVLPPEQRAWGESIIALRRTGTPEEAAAAAVFLASPLASYITGQVLYVDGGWRMT